MRKKERGEDFRNADDGGGTKRQREREAATTFDKIKGRRGRIGPREPNYAESTAMKKSIRTHFSFLCDCLRGSVFSRAKDVCPGVQSYLGNEQWLPLGIIFSRATNGT